MVAFLQHLRSRHTFGIATQQDVDATTGHVRGHRYRPDASRLGHDRSFPRVLFGVQHLVLHTALLQLA